MLVDFKVGINGLASEDVKIDSGEVSFRYNLEVGEFVEMLKNYPTILSSMSEFIQTLTTKKESISNN